MPNPGEPNLPQSPFMQPEPRFAVGISWMLLLTLVAAMTALLAVQALGLPPVRAEFSAWFGVAAPPEGTDRRMQVTFLLLAYSAPLVIGLVARLVHVCLGQLTVVFKARAERDDDAYRME
jgi:hypothetical protein